MPRLLIIFLALLSLSCDRAPLPERQTDALFIGAGIMSATTLALLKELEPELKVEIVERLNQVALESSAAWNNAGTGHAALAELNYTPEKADGTIDISNAVKINEHFFVSKQFWAYQVVNKGLVAKSFIHTVPHLSFVTGEKNVKFLKKRFFALKKHPLFSDMQYSEDHQHIASWIPLVMQGRNPHEKVAATRASHGTDINFGALSKALLDGVVKMPGVSLYLGSEVTDLKRTPDGAWYVIVKDLKNETKSAVRAKFIFIGAGGKALTLLQKAGIAEAKGYGGFPVGGQWLVTDNPELIKQHHAKVYGMAAVGAPPMSVPHLDTRVIDGKHSLLFGPFATFSTKFLKNGSWTDLFMSINFNNILPILQAGWHNIDLTKYLINQVMLSREERVDALKEYFPTAKLEDWRLENAGQRVQIIKNDPDKGGILQFGTELVGSRDGSIIALLGASPGASTSVQIALDVLERCFSDKFKEQWRKKLKEMVPTFGIHQVDEPELYKAVESSTNKILQLE